MVLKNTYTFVKSNQLIGILLFSAALALSFTLKSPIQSKTQYGFIMVINKTGTHLYFSPIFSFEVDKKRKPVCDIGVLESDYRDQVADKAWDAMTSDYFDSEEDAKTARKTYIESEKSRGSKVVEPTAKVAECE